MLRPGPEQVHPDDACDEFGKIDLFCRSPFHFQRPVDADVVCFMNQRGHVGPACLYQRIRAA